MNKKLAINSLVVIVSGIILSACSLTGENESKPAMDIKVPTEIIESTAPTAASGSAETITPATDEKGMLNELKNEKDSSLESDLGSMETELK